MPLKSALEDFEGSTLSSVAGLLGKLRYFAELHDGSGSYSHWGMGRVHGEETARRAIRTSHTAVLSEVLRTPLRVLDEDLRRSASSQQVTTREFLAALKKMAPQALPERPVAATEKHFMAVLRALSALLESPARANRPDASLLPPPVR